MARLYRPHIPLPVRIEVARRQLRELGLTGPYADRRDGENGAQYLARLLVILFDDRKAELHHRPALLNRRSWVEWDYEKEREVTLYDPPANDPTCLVYLVEDDHDIETRVRGAYGAQHSDLAIARIRKRKERKARRAANARPPTREFDAMAFRASRSPRPKRKIPSRPFPKRPPRRDR